MTEQENMMSALDIFAASQETFEEAKKKAVMKAESVQIICASHKMAHTQSVSCRLHQ